MGFGTITTNYILFIIVGVVILIGSLIKLFGFYDFSSDWFWALAGMGLMIEGAISFVKQRMFEKKYKIIERSKTQ